jgi:4-deoxy-L-threo-5-hexosulose-uronate ketol-isomerase
LKQPVFLHRREIGIYNVGGKGKVKVGDDIFELDYKEALYLGSGDREVYFESMDAGNPAKFYFNSAAATCNYTFIWGMAGENLDYGDQDFLEIEDLK